MEGSHLGMSSHGARGAPAQEEGSDIGTKLRDDIWGREWRARAVSQSLPT